METPSPVLYKRPRQPEDDTSPVSAPKRVKQEMKENKKVCYHTRSLHAHYVYAVAADDVLYSSSWRVHYII